MKGRKNPMSEGMGRGFMGSLQEADITQGESMAVGAKDYSAQVLKLKSKDIDGVIIFDAGGDCITFVRQIQAGIAPTWDKR